MVRLMCQTKIIVIISVTLVCIFILVKMHALFSYTLVTMKICVWRQVSCVFLRGSYGPHIFVFARRTEHEKNHSCILIRGAAAERPRRRAIHRLRGEYNGGGSRR